MGSPGHADQPSLKGPTAHPSEVIQEAWHCLARNKAETMSNSILVLVKVNFVKGIVFGMTSRGNRAYYLPGAQCSWARSSLLLI